MCGITGIFNLDGNKVDGSILERMTEALAHRGPNDKGHYIHGNLGLGHRRLSIIDLSNRARQPMANEDGSIWLSYNGEIYNYKELRQELTKKGHHFKSETDSEVILHGYEEEGLEYVKRLNGMFAFALWDNKAKTLYLVRDRYGIKPLYYYYDGNTLLFASEIKALLRHPRVSCEINYDALYEYFTFQNLFRYHTLFKGIFLVPQANILSFEDNRRGFEQISYWDYDFTKCDSSISEEEASNETKRLLEQAVKRQLVADVPVGSYLSGGMDSGSIVAIASQQIPRLPSFTCGFDMYDVSGVESNYDERRDAELMASYYKTEHYEQVINVTDIEWSLPRVVYSMEDLRLGMSYPNYYIARLASKFVMVCLSGAGGDEIYGGYPWRYYRAFRSLDQNQYFDEYYKSWQRLVPDDQKCKFFNQSVLNCLNDTDTFDILRRVFTFNGSLKYDSPEDHIANSLYFEAKTFLHGLFIVQDKLSMACGLEERVPFMDNDLVDFAQRIPIHHKLGNLKKMIRIDEDEWQKADKYYFETNEGKNCLRNAMAQILPAAIIARPKQGFSSPEESWYRGEGISYVRKTLMGSNVLHKEFINPTFVERTIDEHFRQGVNHRLLIWSLLCFEWWCRIFMRGDNPTDI